MNLVKAQELAKELSIPELQQYANGSNPQMMPPYIALGALQAKELMQKKMQAMQGAAQGEQPSVKEQVEQKAGLMALQGQQQQQAQQQMMQQAQARPMPAPENVPQPTDQPEAAPMGMAAGGITRLPVKFNFQNGGIIGYAGPEGSQVTDPVAEARERAIQAQDKLYSFGLRQRQQDPEGYAAAEQENKQARANLAAVERQISGGPAGAMGRSMGESPVPIQAKPSQMTAPPAGMPAPIAGLPAGLPSAMPQPPVVADKSAAMPQPLPAADKSAAMPQPAAPQAPMQQATGAPDQAKLIEEEAARRKAFGVESEIGAGAESRMADKRKRFEASQPSGLDDLIRVFGQAGQYKGLSGMGPAYTSNEDRKRAQRAAFEAQMEEQQTGIEDKRRAEGVTRATGIGAGLAGARDVFARGEEARMRNVTALEAARISAAAQNRPGEIERMMAVYSELKLKDPAAAEEYMKNIGRIRTGSLTGKGVMTRNEAIDNVNKLLVDPAVRMDMTKEAAAGLGKKNPTFSEVQEYFVQKNMGATSPTAPTSRLKFDAQGNQIK